VLASLLIGSCPDYAYPVDLALAPRVPAPPLDALSPPPVVPLPFPPRPGPDARPRPAPAVISRFIALALEGRLSY